MAKKQTELNQSPNLTIPKSEAKERVQSQIDKARKLLQMPIQSEGMFQAQKDAYTKWSDFNSELLKRIFENEHYSQEYAYTFGYVGAINATWDELADKLHSGLRKKLSYMEGFLERIDLIPAPPSPAPKSAGTANQSASPEINQIPEEHLGKDPEIETIFVDIVGFSKKRHTERLEIVSQMNRIVQQEIKTISAESDYFLLIPTGDGIAISILTSNATLQIDLAVNIRAAFRKAAIPTRIGLNKSRDTVVKDVNNRINISGPGIIGAQRIMDFGESYSLNISESVYVSIKDRKDAGFFSVKQQKADKHGNEWIFYDYKG